MKIFDASRFMFAAKLPRAFWLRAITLCILLLLIAPAAAIVWGAFANSGTSLTSAARNDYILQTALYAGLTIFIALCFALPAAWLTVMRRFHGVRIISWALFMPLALPPYIIGYAYSHLWETLTGSQPHGIIAASCVTALAVYPYIYLFARIALRGQSSQIQAAARLIGYSPLAICMRISLPLARPAIIAGVALALMETLNDFALAEHYGVRALGVGVMDLWLNRGDVYSAYKLSALLMLAVVGLLILEERGRQKQRRYAAFCDRNFAATHAATLSRTNGFICAFILFLLAFGGFFLPVLWFAKIGFDAPLHIWRAPFWEGLSGSLSLSFGVAIVLLLCATCVAIDKRRNSHGGLMAPLVKMAQSGYALPGTALALGFFSLATATNNIFLFGGMILLIAACSTRFFMLAAGAIESGMEKISPQLDAAARLANKSSWQILFHIHLPLLRPATAGALLLIFLETLKELPMTLILRPFNFQTLSTVIYQYASDESLELAAPSVLAVAVLGAAAVSGVLWLEGKRLQ